MSDLEGIIGTVLTLLVLSYLIGDNPVYRTLLHVFAGAVAGYTAAIALRFILTEALFTETGSVLVFPIILGILLMIKFYPPYAFVGNFSTAYLVGVGAAVALVGALRGTLLPQVRATAMDGLWLALGTLCTLFAFNYAAQAQPGAAGIGHRIRHAVAWVGRLLLTIALGVAFAGTLTASLSILIGRLQPILEMLLGK